MIVLTAYASLLPDKIEPALEACRTVKCHSLKEPGCERYAFFQDPDDQTKVVFVEEWSSKAVLDAHFAQPAFQEFFAAISDLLECSPEIRIFEATPV